MHKNPNSEGFIPNMNGYIVTENNLDLSNGDFDVDVTYATGYHGTPTILACSDTGPYENIRCVTNYMFRTN